MKPFFLAEGLGPSVALATQTLGMEDETDLDRIRLVTTSEITRAQIRGLKFCMNKEHENVTLESMDNFPELKEQFSRTLQEVHEIIIWESEHRDLIKQMTCACGPYEAKVCDC